MCWITRLQPPCYVLPPCRSRILYIHITMYPRAETYLQYVLKESATETSASMEKVRTWSIGATVGVETGLCILSFLRVSTVRKPLPDARTWHLLRYGRMWTMNWEVSQAVRLLYSTSTLLRDKQFVFLSCYLKFSISCYNPGDLKWLTNEPLTFNTGTSLLSNLQEMLQRDSFCPQKYERARDVKRLKPTDLVNSLVLSDCSISEWYQRSSVRPDVASLPHRETGWNQMQPVMQRTAHASHTCPHCAHLIDTRLQS